jgi:hypothetical protein
MLWQTAYINEFGFFFFLRIAVETSSPWKVSAKLKHDRWRRKRTLMSLCSAPEASLHHLLADRTKEKARRCNVLKVDLLLAIDVIRLGRHVGQL